MAANLVLVCAFALSFGLTVGALLIFRMWLSRTRRRSPLANRQIGHVPGQQLVERLGNSSDDLLFSVFGMTMALPMMLLAWALTRVPPERMRFDGTTWVFVIGAVAIFAASLRGFLKHQRAYRAARDGLLAERVTGMQLNRLMEQGCLVMHDLPGEGFNLDHVVIAPRGVYAVETKSFRKPRAEAGKDGHRVTFDGHVLRFPDFVEREPLLQAERQAQWLAGCLREMLGTDLPVIPALALPGWMIDQSDNVWRSSRVKVFSPMKNGANFMAKEIERLNGSQRRAIASALSVRYPGIAG